MENSVIIRLLYHDTDDGRYYVQLNLTDSLEDVVVLQAYYEVAKIAEVLFLTKYPFNEKELNETKDNLLNIYEAEWASTFSLMRHFGKESFFDFITSFSSVCFQGSHYILRKLVGVEIFCNVGAK